VLSRAPHGPTQPNPNRLDGLVAKSHDGTVDEELRAELLARREEDQRIRHAVMEASNPRTVRSLVGEDGAKAAWLLAQHADNRRDLQRKFLELLRAAVAAGEEEPRELAYLQDRVRVADGRP
jgi:hypothetical protein